MSKLGKKEITEDLLHYDPTTWCRAFFKTHSKCDVVENNMCEAFNSWILAARHKSIVYMLEDIRHKLMNRHADMIKFAETWITDIAPMARTILEENKEYSNPDQHLEHWYRKETFVKAYSHFIQPITNIRMWPKTTNPSIEPPKPRQMPGRPKKNRRKRKEEPKKIGKISKRGVKMTCSICKSYGHNKSVCPARFGQGSTSQPSQPSSVSVDTTILTSQSMGAPSFQSSSVCGDTRAPPKDTARAVHEVLPHKQVRINENYRSVPSFICGDTTSVPKAD